MSNQEPHNQGETKEADVEKRRRFIKGAGIAAPVIMALANRPAFGAVCTVSGFISVDPGNLSAAGHVVASCGGKSPGYWKNNLGDWPTGYVPVAGPGGTPPATIMSTAFGYSGGLAASTLLSVLEGSGGTDPNNVYMHLVAALLNAAKGLYVPVNGLKVDEIKDMYQQISTTNQYQAAPGVFWTPDQLVSFLQQTMTA